MPCICCRPYLCNLFLSVSSNLCLSVSYNLFLSVRHVSIVAGTPWTLANLLQLVSLPVFEKRISPPLLKLILAVLPQGVRGMCWIPFYCLRNKRCCLSMVAYRGSERKKERECSSGHYLVIFARIMSSPCSSLLYLGALMSVCNALKSFAVLAVGLYSVCVCVVIRHEGCSIRVLRCVYCILKELTGHQNTEPCRLDTCMGNMHTMVRVFIHYGNHTLAEERIGSNKGSQKGKEEQGRSTYSRVLLRSKSSQARAGK